MDVKLQVMGTHDILRHPMIPHDMSSKAAHSTVHIQTQKLSKTLETTRTSLYYVDEDYPAGPEIQQPLPE